MKYFLLFVFNTFTLFSEGRLSYLEKYYDLEGNCTNVQEKNDLEETIHEVDWEYDSLGRITISVEGGSKKTLYSYTSGGKIHILTKPDETILIYEYDPLGRQVRLTSSDQSIDYSYIYDLNDGLTASIDHQLKNSTIRKLDGRGRTLEEKLANGILLTKSYDELGRQIVLNLPDDSSIEYIYDAFYLRLVKRNSKDKRCLYTHEYTRYDLSENLLEEKYFDDLIVQTHSFDQLQRKTKTENPYLLQEIEDIDACSNVKHIYSKTPFENEQKTFEYDDQNSLTKETGFESYNYTYDAKHNRIGKNSERYTVNDLNQVISNEESHYEYDPNGNPILIKKKNRELHLTYDALDRLIVVFCPGEFKQIYCYDSFHRRISTTTLLYQEEEALEEETFFYIYNENLEIGKTSSNLEIKELRVLGITPRMELGAAIAIEIEDKIYIPLHDLFSNVILLIDPEINEVVESYNMSAFGQICYPNENVHKLNPWRFCSKRTDDLTGYVFFGRRYYNPDLGRFITCDPNGFSDHYNLYSFVLNNPLSHFDPTGLETAFKGLLENYSNNFMDSLKNPVDFTAGKAWDLANAPVFESLRPYSESSDLLRAFPRDLYKTSYTYDLNRENPSSGRIGFINGIDTLEKESLGHMNYLSGFNDEKNIHGVYNRTRGICMDIVESANQLATGLPTKAVFETKKMWSEYFKTNPNDPFLHICHSQGAIVTRNALYITSKEHRKRIIVVAIAPAAYINKNLCHKVFHYASKNDLVPKIDIIGRWESRDTTTILEPHKEAVGQDHGFQSPTYRNILREHINEYSHQNQR